MFFVGKKEDTLLIRGKYAERVYVLWFIVYGVVRACPIDEFFDAHKFTRIITNILI